MVENRGGRPRSESSRRAILEAARDLIDEVGFERMSIEAIAARAQAGKQTIYRWWPSKSAIVADSFVAGYLRMPAAELTESDSLEQDLKSWLAAMSESMGDRRALSVTRALVAAAADDETEASQLYDAVTGPVHQVLVARLERGRAEGQLPPATDASAAADALLGAVLFRILAGQGATNRLAGVVDALLGFGTSS